MKTIIIVVVIAVAAGLYLVFSNSNAQAAQANFNSLTPAQLLALSPSQIGLLTPSQQAQLAALRANPSNYASAPFTSPSPVNSDAAVLTSGISAIGAAIGTIGSLLNSPNGVAPATSITGGVPVTVEETTGPTYQQAGILPDLPLTAPSPSLLVPINGDPAVIDTGSLTSQLDYPGIQSYMIDPTQIDTNTYDGTGGVFYS